VRCTAIASHRPDAPPSDRSIAPVERGSGERAPLHHRLCPSLPRATGRRRRPLSWLRTMEDLAEGLFEAGANGRDGPVASFFAGSDGLDEPGRRRSNIPQVSSSSLSQFSRRCHDFAMLCSDPPIPVVWGVRPRAC
jgi:hypothetical protein